MSLQNGAFIVRKRRRRKANKSPISARLFLDDRIKGNVGVLSEDLITDLFPEEVSVSGESSRIMIKSLLTFFS